MLIFMIVCASFLVCISLCFFFSGSEVGIISINKYRLRTQHEQGDFSAGKLLELLSFPQRLMIMTLVGNNIAGVLATLFFERMVDLALSDIARKPSFFFSVKWDQVISFLALAPLTIIFAEILPKAIFRAHSNALVTHIHPALAFFLFLMSPLIWLIEKFSAMVLSPFSERRIMLARQVTRADILNLISSEESVASVESEVERHEDNPSNETHVEVGDHSENSKTVSSENAAERQMIQNIMQLQETYAYEIMTPLIDLVAVPQEGTSLEELKVLCRATGYSRIPIYHERIVNIIGYVDIFRVLRGDDGAKSLDDFIEQPYFVPESKSIGALLQDFLERRIRTAIVVDEFGGCSGLIAREDIIEEIVGDLEDELDEPVQMIQKHKSSGWLVDGRTEIDDLNEALGTSFADDEWTTLAGYMMHVMGRIPEENEEVILDAEWHATVLQMDHHRIDRVLLTPLSSNSTPAAEQE